MGPKTSMDTLNEVRGGALTLMTAGVLGGSAISTTATRFATERLWDPTIPAGSALYPILLAFLMLKLPTPDDFINESLAVGSLSTAGSIIFDAMTGGN